jgi:hypothetical protein
VHFAAPLRGARLELTESVSAAARRVFENGERKLLAPLFRRDAEGIEDLTENLRSLQRERERDREGERERKRARE